MSCMNRTAYTAFVNELQKIGGAKIKSNDRMPGRTKANMNLLMQHIDRLEEDHRRDAEAFLKKVGPHGLFDILHGMRRWYSGQTMVHKLREQRDNLRGVMQLEPEDAIGVYRGFKVDKSNPLAQVAVGDKLVLDVTRNSGVSSWSTSQEATNRFSGGGKGKVGLIVRLADAKGVQPLLAPPEKTADWFNNLYTRAVGSSFRPKEGEYLIAAPKVTVEVVRVKR